MIYSEQKKIMQVILHDCSFRLSCSFAALVAIDFACMHSWKQIGKQQATDLMLGNFGYIVSRI